MSVGQAIPSDSESVRFLVNRLGRIATVNDEEKRLRKEER